MKTFGIEALLIISLLVAAVQLFTGNIEPHKKTTPTENPSVNKTSTFKDEETQGNLPPRSTLQTPDHSKGEQSGQPSRPDRPGDRPERSAHCPAGGRGHRQGHLQALPSQVREAPRATLREA